MLAAAPKKTKDILLVVEDDADLRGLYRTTLTAAGYAVVAVEDGIDALRHVEAQLPAAVILDMVLPRLGGRDVYRELRAHPETSRIPIIVVSGTDISDLNPSDFSCLLHKPIHPEALLYAVENCLRRTTRLI